MRAGGNAVKPQVRELLHQGYFSRYLEIMSRNRNKSPNRTRVRTAPTVAEAEVLPPSGWGPDPRSVPVQVPEGEPLQGGAERLPSGSSPRHRRGAPTLGQIAAGSPPSLAPHVTAGNARWDSLGTLVATADLLRTVETRVRRQVAAARAHKATWADIGRALGVTPQAAQQRFGRDSVR